MAIAGQGGRPIAPIAELIRCYGETPSLHLKEAQHSYWDHSRHRFSLRLLGLRPLKGAPAVGPPNDRAPTASTGFGPRPFTSTLVRAALRRPRCRRIAISHDVAARLCPRAGAARVGDRFEERASSRAIADTLAVTSPVSRRRPSSASRPDNGRGDRQLNPGSRAPAGGSPARADSAANCAARAAPAPADPD
jgi:hypothetical protein